MRCLLYYFLYKCYGEQEGDFMKNKLWGLAILLLYSAFFFVGCAQNNPTVSINPTWTEKPTKITVVFTEPFVDNVDDLEDDLEEYTEKFTDWYKAELKKNYDSLVHKSIDVDFRQVNIAGMSIEHDSVGTTEFNIPKPSTINMNEGYYIAISNAGFSRKEETYAYQAYSNSNYLFGSALDSSYVKNSGNVITDRGLWFFADYAIYNQSGERVAFGHEAFHNKFPYAMHRKHWEKCVAEFVKKSLEETPILN